jgi:hypothetical protein
MSPSPSFQWRSYFDCRRGPRIEAAHKRQADLRCTINAWFGTLVVWALTDAVPVGSHPRGT